MVKDLTGEKEGPIRAADSFQDLISITNAVQIECEGYAMLGEYDACRESLLEFKTFVESNELNERNTLIRLNENLKTKQINLVNKFSDIAKKITAFDEESGIAYSQRLLLEEENDD